MNTRKFSRPSVALLALFLGFAPLAIIPGAAVAESATGAYLAARHAAVNDDTDAAATYFTRALSRDPHNVALLEQAVLYKAASGRVESAVPLARTLVEKNARQRVAQLVLLVDEMKRGDFVAARERLEEHGSVAFNTVTEKLTGGWAAFADGDAAAAGELFDSLKGQDFYRVFARYHSALVAAADGDDEAANAAFVEAFGDQQPSVRLAEAYGRFLESKGRHDEAAKIYERALERSPGDSVIGALLVRASQGDSKPDLVAATAQEGAAEALYGLASAFARDEGGLRLSLIYTQLALYLDEGNEAARLLLGNILEAQRRWEAAAETYKAIDNDSAYFRPAQIGRSDALSRVDRIDDALEALNALERRFGDDVTIPISIGDLLRRAERYGEAREAYDRAITMIDEPEARHWSLFYARGVSNERIGEWEKAEADLQKALEFRPDQPHVLNYLGYSWIEKHVNLTEAREMIERAVELRPDDGYITDSLGWAQYKLGDYEAAVKTMQRAVELTPTDPVINDHFGDTLWMVGRKLEAQFQWRRALSFEPEEDGMLERIKRKLEVGLDVVLDEERAALPADAEGVAVREPDADEKADGG